MTGQGVGHGTWAIGRAQWAMDRGALAIAQGLWPNIPDPSGCFVGSSHQHLDLMGSMIITAGEYFVHVFVRRSIGLFCTYHFKMFFLMYSLHFVIPSRNKWYAARDGSRLVFDKLSCETYGLWRAGPIMGYS